MRTRLELQNELVSLFNPDGSQQTIRIYFDPPEGTKLTYPCLLYEYAGYRTDYGDNIHYLRNRSYDLTFIDQDPDSLWPERMYDHFVPYCSPGKPYCADNLYHFPCTIYY